MGLQDRDYMAERARALAEAGRRIDAKQATRRTARRGAFVMAGVWLLVLAGLYFGAAWFETHRLNRIPSHSLGQAGELRIPKGRDGHFRVAGTVGGQAVEFLVDTGATHVAITEALAQRIGLRGGEPVTTRTANGLRPAWLHRKVPVAAGDLPPQAVTVSVGLGGHADHHGLLGQGWLSRYDIQISEREMVLRLRPPR